MAELKPCPFCGFGGINIMLKLPMYKELTSYYVICTGCGARSAAHIEEQWAIKAWNSRAESEELIFTRQFLHDHGLDFALASAWNRRVEYGK